MKCVNCNFENNEGAIFCNNCGNPLIESNNLGNQTTQEAVLNDNITNIETNNNNNHSQPNQINSPISSVNDINNNQQNNQNDMSINQVTDSNNTKKVKKKKKHRFLKFLLFVILLFFAIKGIKSGINWYKDYKITKSLKDNYITFENDIKINSKEDAEKYLTDYNLLNVDSNNDGMTNKEKLDLGLSLVESDSDGDGLTDYDEINKYHSDPKKLSTSGDIFPDSYKVSKNMDINKYYQDNYKYNLEKNNDIILDIDNADDMFAYYKEFTGTIPGEYKLGYKPFRIYSFVGEVELRIDNPDYFNVYSYDTLEKESKKLKSKIRDDKIVFDITNDNPIIISYKPKKYKELINSVSNIDMVEVDNSSSSTTSEYIVIASPIASVAASVPVHVLEINDFLSNTKNPFLEKKLDKYDDDVIIIESHYISRFKTKILDTIFGIFETTIDNVEDLNDISFKDYIFLYKHLYSYEELENFLYGDGEGKNIEDESINNNNNVTNNNSNTNSENNSNNNQEDKKDEEKIYDSRLQKNEILIADSGFDINYNAFRFHNLSTSKSNNGNCTGFAYITSSIYNDNPIPKNGNETFLNSTSYDLSSDYYTNIWNKNLFSYDPVSKELKTYCDKDPEYDKIDSDKIDFPDKDIIKAIEYYLIEGNEDLISSKIIKDISKKMNDKGNEIGSHNKTIKLSQLDIEQIITKFNNKNIVIVSFSNDSDGHSVNAYKLTQDADDEDIFYLKIYDNNYPSNVYYLSDGTKLLLEPEIVLKREYWPSFFGGDVPYYTFNYRVGKNKNYTFYSNFFTNDDLLFISYPGKAFGFGDITLELIDNH